MKRVLAWSIAFALMVVPGLYAQDIQSDDFSDGLQPFWEVQNSDLSPWSVKDGQLVIEAGFNQNLWANDDTTRFYQMTSEDFEIETSMVVDYMDASTVAGLVVYSATTKDHQDRDGQWVTLKLWGRGGDDQNAVLQYQRRENDSADLGYVGTQPDYLPSQGVIPLDMRIKKVGDEYTAWFKPESQGDWVDVGMVTNELQPPLEVGMMVGIADGPGAGVMTVTYDYFKEASSSFPTAVDPADRLTLTWGGLKSQ